MISIYILKELDYRKAVGMRYGKKVLIRHQPVSAGTNYI